MLIQMHAIGSGCKRLRKGSHLKPPPQLLLKVRRRRKMRSVENNVCEAPKYFHDHLKGYIQKRTLHNRLLKLQDADGDMELSFEDGSQDRVYAQKAQFCPVNLPFAERLYPGTDEIYVMPDLREIRRPHLKPLASPRLPQQRFVKWGSKGFTKPSVPIMRPFVSDQSWRMRHDPDLLHSHPYLNYTK